MRREAAIEFAPRGFLTDEAKRKLRLPPFTSKLLFDGQIGSIYKENSSENQEILIRNAVSNQAKPNPLSSSSKKPKAKSGKKKPKPRETPKRTSPFLLLDPLKEEHLTGDLGPLRSWNINIVRVPQTRQMNKLETVRMFSQKTSVSARDFVSLLGQLSAAADLVMLGQLHLRPFQMSLPNQWKPQELPLCHQIGMTTEILQHLKWWLQEDRYHQGIPLRIDPPSHTIFTDASLSGWGAHEEPEGLLFHGVWTEDQSRLHINVLMMKAIFLSLSRAVHMVKNSTVLVSTDNTTVVAYIRHQGGTHSTELSEEVWNILNLCLAHNIQLLAKHIPGRFNTLADRMSHIDKPISTEWSLNQEIANKIFQIMDFPLIDLFATRLNHRLPLFVSPIPDQKALSIDALSMDWNPIHAYAFPPFHLIPAVINKIRLSQCKIVLIAPLWPDRPWFPELLGLLVSPPVSLPVIPNLLAQLKGRFLHQNLGHLQLHAWELSNNLSEIDNFQAMMRSTSPKLEGS